VLKDWPAARASGLPNGSIWPRKSSWQAFGSGCPRVADLRQSHQFDLKQQACSLYEQHHVIRFCADFPASMMIVRGVSARWRQSENREQYELPTHDNGITRARVAGARRAELTATTWAADIQLA
jgi:hypothetical protein